MAAERYSVEVRSDFLGEITRARPIPSRAELIWNVFDGDASVVEISLEFNDVDSLDAIVVRDDGEGVLRPRVADVQDGQGVPGEQ